MALIAKMIGSEVVGVAGGRYVPCEPDDEGAKTVEEYGGGLSGGAPSWLRDATHVRYEPLGKHQERIKLSAVHSASADDPNKEWAEASPVGSLEMTIQNPGAWGYIEPGQEYFVEIRKARK